MLRMSFRNLRFSRRLFCSSGSITKRAIFLFSLYVSFRIDTLTLANVGINWGFFAKFYKHKVDNQFSKLCFLLFEISNNLNQIMPMLPLDVWKYYLGHTTL